VLRLHDLRDRVWLSCRLADLDEPLPGLRERGAPLLLRGATDGLEGASEEW